MVLGLAAVYLLGKSRGKKKAIKAMEVEDETPLEPSESFQDWSNFYQDTRSFEELLEKARKK